MNHKILATLAFVATLLAGSPLVTTAANKKTTVKEVTESVTISDDVDYTVTSATPFADGAVLDIANTDHAVVILSGVKPSAALKLLANHVTIGGEKAVNNTNCQVKLYNLGTIILPYANKDMLTVYSEPNFGGTAVSNFGTEHSGGYMNTLTAAKLNNQIRSFRLKRGYMVTFSTLPGGRGYSRCFIAADQDLEVATLPAVLDNRISSYRVFKWYDAGKKQLANDLTKSHLDALNVQSSYTWSQGSDMAPDYECVPNHIYEDYPSSAAIGQATWSPHSKNNNEPRNQSDDHPQDLTTILNNWENMMRTGMRLCTPASWDGSDYWNATGFLAEFLDSIDARGWRCDIIDLHCYWAEGSFGNIKNWVDKYKRPVWISEWCWGASWNSNGAFASGVTESQVKEALQRICTSLNGWNYVERYYYWNGERDPSRLLKDNGTVTLTPAGQYYASMNSGLGYNGKYDFVPTTPRQYAPTAFSVTTAGGKTTIKWRDQNGEYNQLMQLERKVKGGQWQLLADIEQKEQAANYTYTDDEAPDGAAYRLHLIDLNGNSYYTNNDMDAGDQLTLSNGDSRYVGGNLLTNGDFNLGMQDWTSGTGTAIAQPYFQVVPTGSIDGGAYLQAYGTGGANTAQSLKRYVAVTPGTDYLFRCASRNGGNNQAVNASPNNTSTGTRVARIAASSEWLMQDTVFNSGTNSYVLVTFSTLQAKAQFDKLELRPLFATRQEAVAHGVEALKQEAHAVAAYYPHAPIDDVETTVAAITGTDDQALATAQAAISDAIAAINAQPVLDSLLTVAQAVHEYEFPGRDELEQLILKATEKNMKTAAEIVDNTNALKAALATFCTMTAADAQPKSPKFAATTGWEVKKGTYTGGDQRTNTVNGTTCWNAWWSGVNASTGQKQTMEVRQTLNSLPEGLYALACKASTQHYCLSDQHGYLTVGGETVNTPVLTADYMDLPTVGNIWQTLTTPPVYVEAGSSVAIGFKSSKQGATDNAWHAFGDATSKGDKREGWWCATDFQLLYHPLKKLSTAQGTWGTLCLPYAYEVPQGLKVYEVAGVLADHSRLCLQPLTTVAAGKPVVYYAETANAVVYEYGDKAKAASSYTQENNLRGYFETTTANKAPVDAYMLTDGVWVRVTDTRPVIPSYSAIVYKLDGMTELTAWDGASLPMADSMADGLSDTHADQRPTAAYSLGGQRTGATRGIVIETDGRNTRKVLR